MKIVLRINETKKVKFKLQQYDIGSTNTKVIIGDLPND